MAPQELLPNGLPDNKRYVTTNNAQGKAILSTAISPKGVWQNVQDMANFFLAWTTNTFPVVANPSTSNESPDITSYSRDLEAPPGLSKSGGSVLRFVDFSPNQETPMHTTVSVDYGVVIEGTMELELDSGEKQIMHRGDVCVQRLTAHAWNNKTENNGWARMMFVLLGAEKPEGLEEEGVSGMARPSD